MPYHVKGRQAVYVCSVPPGFKPQRLWDFPAEILSARLHAKNLPMRDALGFARAYNQGQVQALQHEHRPIESWAIVCRHLKPNWHGHPLLKAEQQEGGVL